MSALRLQVDRLVWKEAVAAILEGGHRDDMGRSEQISQDLVKDWLHDVGKGDEVVSTVMTKFPAGAAGGWEGNS